MKKGLIVLAVMIVAAEAFGQWQTDGNGDFYTSHKVSIGATPSLPFQVYGVLPAGGIQYGSFFSINSAASTNGTIQQAAEVELQPGYTGTGSTAALGFRNKAAGAGTSVDISNFGNYGVFGVTTGDTVGDNAGAVGYAINGQYNFGLVGNAMVPKVSSKNVAVLGYAMNNGSDVAVGGYFALAGSTQKPRFTTAALIADNADLAASAPIFLGRSGGVTKVTIDKSGNVNIDGTLTATSVVNAVYGQDVAEWVRSDRELSAGTVVVLNPETTDQVIPSTQAYDTTVAGVVSAQPGVILGRPGALKATVATSGRVRVRVDARKGPIHVGDLLVTGEEPGTAMKSQPIELGGRKFHQPGTILGKALEPLPDGVGEILVLLCLG